MNKINPDVPGKKRINFRWQRSIAIFALLTSILVSGCAVGPDFMGDLGKFFCNFGLSKIQMHPPGALFGNPMASPESNGK